MSAHEGSAWQEVKEAEERERKRPTDGERYRHLVAQAEATEGAATEAAPDPVIPSYYYRDGIEVVDVANAWGLGRWETQALQYLLRAKFKGDEVGDLKKARKLIDFALATMERK